MENALESSLPAYPQPDLCVATAEGGQVHLYLIDMAYIHRPEATTADSNQAEISRSDTPTDEIKYSPSESEASDISDPEIEAQDIDYTQLPQDVYERFAEYEALDLLCEFCSALENLKWSEDVRVKHRGKTRELVQVLCKGCRAKISKSSLAKCTAGSPHCAKTRYVDELGAIAPKCKKCHQYRSS